MTQPETEPGLERRAKRRELYGRLLMFALIMIVAPWLALVWEFTTGAEVSTHRSIGQASKPEHLTSTRKFAIVATFLGVPFALWCSRKRREMT